MGPDPLNPVVGMVFPQIKAAHGVLSADRSPGSDEMHDPVPTHVPSEEPSYILETVAGTRNEDVGDPVHGDTRGSACVQNE